MSAPPSSPPPPDPPPPSREATLGQTIAAVFWSFFGVRKGKSMERDAVTIKPLKVIVIGLILAALFVFTLLAIVRLVLATT